MRRGRKAGPPTEPKPPTASADADQAWKALSLVNDWVKHAEAKLGITLAATGVSGGVLFNLVKGRGHTSLAFQVAAAVCGASAVAAGICAGVGIYPVLRLQRRSANEAANPLFFHDIATAYKADAPSYSAVLHTLTTDSDDLILHLGQQVHANATVAQRKYRWVNRAIRALLLDLLALGALAAVIALKW